MRRRSVLATTLARRRLYPRPRRRTPAPPPPAPRHPDRRAPRLDAQAVYFVSYDGLVNNESFQQSGILTYEGYQYAAWYTADRIAVVGRRALGGSTWQPSSSAAPAPPPTTRTT